ncbi:MAG: molecular chaperone DnaJ [Candidatus Paraimprobicoccus trichonymphae]|uniref:Chaperone protein DnaJ n=1 Tax=Candidatus Paraimprobicoccus trichonymphae TaxID=3033793 RepID=A0AA48I512_9FIRM|nr:MAG: molecular chaperone DnaJ [Candidatus Paraimprobicoccus trichonymphae]
MADKRDFYNVLEINKNASEDEIKKAYRKLAKKYHPDLNPGDKQAEKNFKEVSEAYEVLSDKGKKARYDQFGHAGVDPSYSAGGGGYSYSSGNPFGEEFDLGDIFSSFFGGFGGNGSNSRGAKKGSDIQANVNISFEESAKGCSKNISYTCVDKCDNCNGTGNKSGTSPKTCPACKGRGQVTISQRTPFGVIQTTRTCDRCQGSGKIISDPCKVCSGEGRVRKNKNLEIKIPAGINNEQILNIRNKGNTGINGGSTGDLHVYVKVSKHNIFERKDNDIWCTIPITFTQAALGATIIIPTLDGRVEYVIHEGTQNGDIFKLKNKGIPNIYGKGQGDQYVKVHVEIPRNLSIEQKEILKKFGDNINEKNYQKNRSFFDKLKDLFGS